MTLHWNGYQLTDEEVLIYDASVDGPPDAFTRELLDTLSVGAVS